MTAADPYLELQAVEAWLGPRRVFDNLSLLLHRGEHRDPGAERGRQERPDQVGQP